MIIADPAAQTSRAAAQTMRALLIDGPKQAPRIADMQIPEIGPRDALVRLTASGICRSDWHLWNGDFGWAGLDMPWPAILGHEIAGVVEAVGGDVRRIATGTRVTSPFSASCGSCHYCERGSQNLCDEIYSPMLNGVGGWAEYMVVRNADLNCIPLPDGVDDLSAAALGCRYMTAWRAITARGAMKAGETVVIAGCGGVGEAAIEIATALGGQVIALDVDDAKLGRIEQRYGARSMNVRGMAPEAAGEAVRAMTPRGAGAEVSVDALGSSGTFLTALHALAKGGRIVQVGLTSQEEKGVIAAPIDMFVHRELTLAGSSGNPIPQFDELLRLVAAGRLKPSAMVSRTVAMRDVHAVLDDMTHYRTDGFVIITDFQ